MPVRIENVRHWITLDNFQKSSLLSRSVLLEVKKLGLLSISRSPAAFHVCRTESDRVGLEMVWETTEESFFKTSDPARVRLTRWEMLFGSWRELQAGRTS